MNHRKSTSGHQYIVGWDTETDYDPETDTRFICQWAVCILREQRGGIQKVMYHGYTRDELIACFETLMTKTGKFLMYAHNLDYDISYIWGWIKEQQDAGTEVTIIARDGSAIIVQVGDKLVFRDSSKKLSPGTSVQDMGEMIKLPKLYAPHDGDFHVGWSAGLTDEDFQYVERDAEIVARTMWMFHKEGLTHATYSGDAYAQNKTMYNKVNFHYDSRNHIIGHYKTDFPELPYETDKWIRGGYFGGINFSRPGHYKGKIIDLDCNSMYPSAMHDKLLPYGEPHLTDNPVRDGYKLWMIHGRFKFKLKKGKIPWLRIQSAYIRQQEGIQSASDPVIQTHHFHEFTFTNIDLLTLDICYDVEIDTQFESTMIGFDSRVGMFNGYIDHYFKQKHDYKALIKQCEQTGQETPVEYKIKLQIAKLMLNSLYGRFGLRPEKENTSIVWDEKLGYWNTRSVNECEEMSKSYVPIAAFTTAWARNNLITTADKIGMERVIHMDTDSIIYLARDDDPEYPFISDKLGDWKQEYTALEQFEGGVKRYVIIKHTPVKGMDDIAVTCAGVNKHFNREKCPIGMWIELLDDPELIGATGTVLGRHGYKIKSGWLRAIYRSHGLNPDDVNTMKLQKQRFKGGINLIERQFTLQDNMRVRY